MKLVVVGAGKAMMAEEEVMAVPLSNMAMIRGAMAGLGPTTVLEVEVLAMAGETMVAMAGD